MTFTAADTATPVPLPLTRRAASGHPVAHPGGSRPIRREFCTLLHGEWIKLSSIRSNRAVLGNRDSKSTVLGTG